MLLQSQDHYTIVYTRASASGSTMSVILSQSLNVSKLLRVSPAKQQTDNLSIESNEIVPSHVIIE